MNIRQNITTIVIAGATSLVIGGTGAYAAGTLIHSDQIATGAVTAKKLGTGSVNTTKLTPWIHQQVQNVAPMRQAANNAQKDANTALSEYAALGNLDGAVYRTETYLNGGGGSATVACADDDATSQQYVAISGGVQGSTVDSQSQNGFAVSSSFPGRMDWSTNTVKPNRLDGWIVLGNDQSTQKLVVWALCVPKANISVQNTNLDN